MTTPRLTPADRTRALLDTALDVASVSGWQRLTHASVALAAGVSSALVVHRLGTMDAMRRSVMRQAVKQHCVPVVAEGLCLGDKHARKADDELKAAAAEWVKR
jgi:AcrR family transcriptional regulator